LASAHADSNLASPMKGALGFSPGEDVSRNRTAAVRQARSAAHPCASGRGATRFCSRVSVVCSTSGVRRSSRFRPSASTNGCNVRTCVARARLVRRRCEPALDPLRERDRLRELQRAKTDVALERGEELTRFALARCVAHDALAPDAEACNPTPVCPPLVDRASARHDSSLQPSRQGGEEGIAHIV